MSTGTMTGSDPESLDTAAGQLDQAAQELDDSAAALARTLGSLSWLGQVAIRFSDSWNGGHQKRMAVTAGFLRTAAEELRKQAGEQRDASRGDDAAWARSARPDSTWVSPELMALLKRLHDMRLASPAEQLAWWNSLSDQQRQLLLAEGFMDLIALHGLPDDVLDQAYENYFTSISGDLETGSSSIHGEIEVKVVGVDIGAGFDAEMTVYKDGSVKIDVSEALKGGASDNDLKAAASLGVGGTFEFASEAEARAWLADLGKAIARGDLVGFLKESAAHLGSVSVEVGAEGSAGAAGVGVKAGAGVSMTVDTLGEGKGNVTLSAKGSLSGKAESGSFGVTGEVEAKVSATFDGTTPKSISFQLEYKGAALHGAFSDVASAGSGATYSGTAEITLDLTRPELAAVAPALAAAISRGDVAEASRIATSVMDQAQVVLQTSVGTQTKASFGGSVLGTGFEAEYSTNTSTTTATYVKPPYGELREVK